MPPLGFHSAGELGMNSARSLSKDPSCFPSKNLIRGEFTKKGSRSEITSTSLKKKITSRSPLRFLRKCAGRNLISARSLYSFDDAIDQVIKTAS